MCFLCEKFNLYLYCHHTQTLNTESGLGWTAYVPYALIAFLCVLSTILIYYYKALEVVKVYNNKKHINKLFAILLFAVFIVVLWAIMGLYYASNVDNTAEIGDSFGAFNALFSGLALVGVIVAIYLQGLELKETQKELRGQKNELVIQNSTSKRDRFESTFFSMSTMHRKIIDELNTGMSNTQMTRISSFYNSLNIPWDDRAFFSIKTRDKLTSQNFDDRLKKIRTVISEYDPNGLLDSYFRYLYRIILFVDDYDVSNIIQEPELDGEIKRKYTEFDEIEFKSKYIDILRAQLSSYELALVFYNCLNPEYVNFKFLCIKYRLFDNIRLANLKAPFDIFFYPSKAVDHVELRRYPFDMKKLSKIFPHDEFEPKGQKHIMAKKFFQFWAEGVFKTDDYYEKWLAKPENEKKRQYG